MADISQANILKQGKMLQDALLLNGDLLDDFAGNADELNALLEVLSNAFNSISKSGGDVNKIVTKFAPELQKLGKIFNDNDKILKVSKRTIDDYNDSMRKSNILLSDKLKLNKDSYDEDKKIIDAKRKQIQEDIKYKKLFDETGKIKKNLDKEDRKRLKEYQDNMKTVNAAEAKLNQERYEGTAKAHKESGKLWTAMGAGIAANLLAGQGMFKALGNTMKDTIGGIPQKKIESGWNDIFSGIRMNTAGEQKRLETLANESKSRIEILNKKLAEVTEVGGDMALDKINQINEKIKEAKDTLLEAETKMSAGGGTKGQRAKAIAGGAAKVAGGTAMKVAGKAGGAALGGLADLGKQIMGMLGFLRPLEKIISMIMEALGALSDQSKTFQKDFNIGATAANKMAGSMYAASDFMNQGPEAFKSMQESFAAIADYTGDFRQNMNGSVKTVSRIKDLTGATAEEAAKVTKTFQIAFGYSNQQVEKMVMSLRQDAQMAGVNFKGVMQDTAKAAGRMAMYSESTAKGVMKAAIEARKMGGTLETWTTMADSFGESWENSIEGANKFNRLAGKQLLDAGKLRMFGLTGEVDKMQAYIKDSLKKISPDDLKGFKGRQMAKALGMSDEEFSKMVAQIDLERDLLPKFKDVGKQIEKSGGLMNFMKVKPEDQKAFDEQMKKFQESGKSMADLQKAALEQGFKQASESGAFKGTAAEFATLLQSGDKKATDAVGKAMKESLGYMSLDDMTETLNKQLTPMERMEGMFKELVKTIMPIVLDILGSVLQGVGGLITLINEMLDSAVFGYSRSDTLDKMADSFNKSGKQFEEMAEGMRSANMQQEKDDSKAQIAATYDALKLGKSEDVSQEDQIKALKLALEDANKKGEQKTVAHLEKILNTQENIVKQQNEIDGKNAGSPEGPKKENKVQYKASTVAVGAAAGAGAGALVGTFLLPGVGTALGAKIGAVVGGYVAPHVEKAWNDVSDWTEQAAKDTAEWLGKAGDETKKWVKEAAAKTNDWLAGGDENVKQKLDAAAKSIEEGSKQAGEGMSDFYSGLKNMSFDEMWNGLKKSWEGVKKMFSGLGDYWDEFKKKFSNFASELWAGIKEQFSGFFDNISQFWESLKALPGKFLDFFKSLPDKFMGLLGAIPGKFMELLDAINPINKAKDLASGIWGGIKGFFGGSKSSAGDIAFGPGEVTHVMDSKKQMWKLDPNDQVIASTNFDFGNSIQTGTALPKGALYVGNDLSTNGKGGPGNYFSKDNVPKDVASKINEQLKGQMKDTFINVSDQGSSEGFVGHTLDAAAIEALKSNPDIASLKSKGMPGDEMVKQGNNFVSTWVPQSYYPTFGGGGKSGKAIRQLFNIGGTSSYVKENEIGPDHVKQILSQKGDGRTLNAFKPLIGTVIEIMKQWGYPVNIGPKAQFNYRLVRGSTSGTLSNHSFGSAADIRVPQNPLDRSRKGKEIKTDMPPSMIHAIYKALGDRIYWGGLYGDAMHFELNRASDIAFSSGEGLQYLRDKGGNIYFLNSKEGAVITSSKVKADNKLKSKMRNFLAPGSIYEKTPTPGWWKKEADKYKVKLADSIEDIEYNKMKDTAQQGLVMHLLKSIGYSDDEIKKIGSGDKLLPRLYNELMYGADPKIEKGWRIKDIDWSALKKAVGSKNAPDAAGGGDTGGGGGDLSANFSGNYKEALKAMIKRHEGVRNKVYLDSRGFPTVGVGHLLRADEKAMWPVGTDIGEAKVQELWAKDFDGHAGGATKFPGFDRLDKIRQAAIVDLAFNMGTGWYKKFPSATKAIESGDWVTASAQLLDSGYAKQVGNRAKEIADMILTGQHNKGSRELASFNTTTVADAFFGKGMVEGILSKGKIYKPLVKDSVAVGTALPAANTNVALKEGQLVNYLSKGMPGSVASAMPQQAKGTGDVAAKPASAPAVDKQEKILSELKKTNTLLATLLNSPSGVYMDGSKVGEVINKTAVRGEVQPSI